MSVINNNLLLTAAAGATGYQVSRSLRFNGPDSAYLSKNFASAGNRKTWTWSGWIKLSKLDNWGALFKAGSATSSPTTQLYLYSDNTLEYITYSGSTQSVITTTQVFRDPSAWYHILLAIDTTQATANNRQRLYINGVEVTTFTNRTNHSQNYDTFVNDSTYTHEIGRTTNIGGSSAKYFDGYMADIWFLDGIAATPSDFAETDATTGQWSPKAYAGSKPGNSFHLDFSDNSAATAAALGKDSSGNGLNWSPTNFSVTAGAGNDSLTDTPTSYGTDDPAGGTVRGNYCTWNGASIGADATLSNGNLDISYGSSGTRNGTMGTLGMSSGKWYWEVTITASSTTNTNAVIGISNKSSASEISNYPGFNANGWGYYGGDGQNYNNGVNTGSGATYGANDVIGVAFDADAGTLVFYKNGTSQGTAYSGLAAGTYFPGIGDGGSTSTFSASANFGQRPFAYQTAGTNRPASTFKALCDTNLTAPVIAKPNTAFDIKLYTGNGGTQTVSGLNFSPDWIWFKQRNTTRENHLYDSVRGVQKALYTDLTNAEATDTDALSSFNSDGWTMGADGGSNQNGGTYVAWCWDAGSSTVTNTQGSITSQVRANPSAGFSIATYTGNGVNGSSFGHGLSATPEFFIIKSLSLGSWFVWHKSLPSNEYNLVLNNTSPQASLGAAYWYTLNSSILEMTSNAPFKSGPHVMYAWSSVNGLSSFGSFTGNGSTDGPMIWTGHRSRWLMIKRTDSFGWWSIWDTARNTYNAANTNLWANSSDQETTSSGTAYDVDFLASGFKLRTNHADRNASGGTYVYASFSEAPFQYARAR